jgi:hypothetical protein
MLSLMFATGIVSRVTGGRRSHETCIVQPEH